MPRLLQEPDCGLSSFKHVGRDGDTDGGACRVAQRVNTIDR